jgi:SWI/SNF-related matrix-associated actin-dependent regulator 1 of chromatin subfamily A
MPLDLFPYQEEGAAFLASKERACLFDEMGIGKTAQLIRALDVLGARRVIIVCPAAVREVWVGELRKFARIPRKILKGADIQDLKLWLVGRADVLLLSYEMATTWAKRIEGDIFDALVFDEAHYLKSADALRTRAMLGHDCDGKRGLARWAAHVFMATGTPNPNDAADLWSMLRFTGATRLTRKTFRDRYYKTRFGAYSERHEPRAEMLPELQQAIRSVSLRRTKKDVGLQLPPIWFTTHTVDGDASDIRELLAGHPGLEDAIVQAVNAGGLSFLDAQHISTLRRLVGEAKAPAYTELLKEELRNGLDQVVVFGIHRRALDHIHSGLVAGGVSVVRFDGETTERDREDAVARFQLGAARVFLGNIRAAGTGLTLTAGAHIDMFESSWAPADNLQAIMRVHRIGQDRHVTARFISLSKSIDETVNEVVAWKTAAIGKVESAA